jgi:hypothetical protein
LEQAYDTGIVAEGQINGGACSSFDDRSDWDGRPRLHWHRRATGG